MPFQIKEPDLNGQDKRFSYFIYLDLNKETHRLSWLDNNFHPNLAISDKLISFIKRKPKLPWSFGRHREAQDFKVKFWNLSLGKPHKKFLKAISNLLKNLFEKQESIHCIWRNSRSHYLYQYWFASLRKCFWSPSFNFDFDFIQNIQERVVFWPAK